MRNRENWISTLCRLGNFGNAIHFCIIRRQFFVKFYENNILFRPNSDKFYYFTKLAVELNEEEEGVARTDTRLRPDQRLMEKGQWDEGNKEKVRLEDKQRIVRRQKEEEAEQAMAQGTI